MSTEPTTTTDGVIQHIWCSATITKKLEDVFVGLILLQAQQQANISEYVVYVTSLGGLPFSGVSLYTFLQSIPQKTRVYNMGMIASAAVPFFLGFKERYGVPHCSFMIHQTSIGKAMLPDQLTVSELETQKANLAATDTTTQQIVLSATTTIASKKLTPSAIRNAFVKSTTYDAAEAVERGFISRIRNAHAPGYGRCVHNRSIYGRAARVGLPLTRRGSHNEKGIPLGGRGFEDGVEAHRISTDPVAGRKRTPPRNAPSVRLAVFATSIWPTPGLVIAAHQVIVEGVLVRTIQRIRRAFGANGSTASAIL
jgi:ATP-dependent protease ClpP protease subunit